LFGEQVTISAVSALAASRTAAGSSRPSSSAGTYRTSALNISARFA
jgi:hypothetical protein